MYNLVAETSVLAVRAVVAARHRGFLGGMHACRAHAAEKIAMPYIDLFANGRDTGLDDN